MLTRLSGHSIYYIDFIILYTESNIATNDQV